MIPFTNQICNDSLEDPKLFKSFKILEITLSTVCFILCFYFIIASFKGEFGVSSKYQLLAKEKFYNKRARFQIIILGSEEAFMYLLDQEYLSICWGYFLYNYATRL